MENRTAQHGDGMFEVQILDDGMKAVGEFRPPVGNGLPLVIDHVQDVLNSFDVNYNVEWLKVHESIAACNHEHRLVSGVVIAQGKKPEPAIPERLIIEETFRRRHPVAGVVKKEGGAIDLRERHLFIVVHQGDVIARRAPAQEGAEGLTVQSEPVPIPSPSVPQPQLGENVEEVDGVVTALVSGQLIFDDSIIEVHETLHLPKGIGYHTGHIRFPGDCLLVGRVRQGFKIWLGGRLHAKETIDVTEVFCGGHIVCDGGFMGHGPGIVRSKDRIRARFVENCRVESHGALYIQQSVLYGHLATLDRVVMGDRSKIVSSEIVAAKGVFAHSLGSETGAPAVVRVGINFAVERKINTRQERVQKLTERIVRLQTRLDQRETSRGQQHLQELKDEKAAEQEKIGELLGALDSNEDAIVAVKETVYAGTAIHICRFHTIVQETAKGVQFRLDAAAGKIVSEKLDASAFPQLEELESGD